MECDYMKTINAVSLFSGAGGMDVGFEKTGVNVLVANEIMPEASQTYIANHPNSVIIMMILTMLFLL